MAVNFKLLMEKKKEDEHTLHVVISGDKSFNRDSSLIMKVNGSDEMVSGEALLDAVCNRMLRKGVEEGLNIVVRYGDNYGVDSMVEDYCRRHNYMPKQHKTNWDKAGSGAIYKRCEDMFVWIGSAPHKGAILLWDGEDRHTKYLIFCGWMFSVPTRVFNYIEKRWLSKDEIENIQMEVRQEQIAHGRFI